MNLSSVQNPVRVAFGADDGRPLALPFVVTQQDATQAASGSSVERTVQPGATLLIESEAPSSTTVTDDHGAQIGVQALALPAMGHASFGGADRFSMTSGRRGIFEFRNTAGGAVTGLGLRFSSFGSFTSIPPAP